MNKLLRIISASVVLLSVNGAAFGDVSSSLAGRLYSNSLQSVEFLTENTGRVIEGGSEVEFSYEVDELVVYFEGANLKSEFRRSWLIMEGGRNLVSADGRNTLLLVRPVLVSAAIDVDSALFDTQVCPPHACHGGRRCYYTGRPGNCVIYKCVPAKSCE